MDHSIDIYNNRYIAYLGYFGDDNGLMLECVMLTGFLNQIPRPIVALSPMDGVSDAAFRYVTAEHGNPDLTITEFVHVIGICRGGERLWQDFIFNEIERPVIAQLFGAEPEYFYHAAKIVCELGFTGVDINMGCPAKTVAERGAGAALIRTPALAQEIVRQTQAGVRDWYETGELTGLEPEVAARVHNMVENRKQMAERTGLPFRRYANGDERSMVPVSVKTRIGYSEVTIAEWIKYLAEVQPEWITVHGRTLKQMYTGQADWDAIATAVASVPEIPVMANGDIKSKSDIKRVLAHTNAQGVWLGRAAYGNPWIFRDAKLLDQEQYIPSLAERFDVMREHAKLHVEFKGPNSFIQMRKHLSWYASGFDGAVEMRKQMVQANSVADVENILQQFNHLLAQV